MIPVLLQGDPHGQSPVSFIPLCCRGTQQEKTKDDTHCSSALGHVQGSRCRAAFVVQRDPYSRAGGSRLRLGRAERAWRHGGLFDDRRRRAFHHMLADGQRLGRAQDLA